MRDTAVRKSDEFLEKPMAVFEASVDRARSVTRHGYGVERVRLGALRFLGLKDGLVGRGPAEL